MFGPMAKTVVLPLELIREIPGMRLHRAMESLRAGQDPADAGYQRVTVRVARHSDLLAVNTSIQAMGYDTRAALARLDEMRSFFVLIDVLLAAVGTIALVVSGLGILNTLLMSVLERQQEIGIYKAIGASDGDLVILFLTEAGIVGLVGGLGGLLLGRCASWVLDLGINVYARHHGVTAHLGIFSFPPWLLVSTAVFSALISILAGVYPALRAARVDPIRSLRRE
jgi:ABC-type antimicrobial peptide transport system permease subunit